MTPARRRYSPFRFWMEVIVLGIAAALAVLTLAMPQWIEAVFTIDPDRGSGTLEWAIVGALIVVSVVMLVLAVYERRAPRAIA